MEIVPVFFHPVAPLAHGPQKSYPAPFFAA
jgi:hypothetical protein